MPDPLPLSGTTLVVGPSNVGKTCLTARTLTRRLERNGPTGVVVFDFAPEVERDGRILGGRLDRFVTPPADVWQGVLDAHAPRATADTVDEALALAADNARRAGTLFDAAPSDPRAVFVNDATIPFQHPDADPDRLRAYCAGADLVVTNALEADAIVADDAVSRAERAALDSFRGWADRVVRLDGDG